MDANGTRFHLQFGEEDWGRCLVESEDGTWITLAEVLKRRRDGQGTAEDAIGLDWHAASASVRLAGRVFLFPRARGSALLPTERRRGAGRDRYGNWYVIDEAESGVRMLPRGAHESVPFWSAADRVRQCQVTELADGGAFATCAVPSPPNLLLRGLAVTTRHYLVVGDVTEHGLLIFDLHDSGGPLLLEWPADVPFTPWDLAARPDGGVLVLDRQHATYWALDADFRLCARVDADTPTSFQPLDPAAPRSVIRGAAHPLGYPLQVPTLTEPPLSPVAIEAGPDGTVLILDTDVRDPGVGRPFSVVRQYDGEKLLETRSLQDAVAATDSSVGEGETRLFSVQGHDLAYVERQEADRTVRIVYVADRGGKQVFGFTLDDETGELVDRREFLPLRRWGAKALVAAGATAYYDFGDRWVPLQSLAECHYAGRAVLRTAPTPDGPGLPSVLTDPRRLADDGPAPSGPFDGGEPGVVWHRLMLDADVPIGAGVHVRARAADERDLLEASAWLPQPDPYLRGDGAEIPFYDPWADLRARPEPFPETAGTWELLFQQVKGRYLQVELTIEGTGRSTPSLRALRAWFPRFSYSEQYLPAIYREEPVAASFAERLLANFEGFFTVLEDKIDHLSELLDPRTTPPDALDWMACWFGLALDPLWDEGRRRFFIRYADRIFRRRGTLGGLEVALRLYLDRVVSEELLDVRCQGQGRVRIVEQFQLRGSGALAFGPPTETGERPLHPLTPADVLATAHRFTVLVPHDLTAEDLAMVDRIVALAKPAHTDFDVSRYWELFRVGEARLGLDTRLGESGLFEPFELGVSYLPDGYLVAPYPASVEDRVVLDRDRLGDLPAL